MSAAPLAERIVAELVRRRARVGAAESLTGGLLTSALVDVPGASAVVSGGVVAYATPLKAELLDVDAALLDRVGAIDQEVARQMALGVRSRLGVDYGIATTGAAGPDPQDGHPPGTVWVAVADADGVEARALALEGGRSAIRAAAVRGALELLAERIGIGSASSE